MTSNDVREMLDLPGEAGPRPQKKQKLTAPPRQLKGLAREVQNLSNNPIATIPEATVFKKRRFYARKPAAKWDLKPFTNSARQDKDFVLRHWKRREEVPPEANGEEEGIAVPVEAVKPELVAEDSSFAKYNVQVSVPQYDDEIYHSKLASDDWSKDETDYLMGLAQEYDLRWPVVWDRYEYMPLVPQMEEGAMEVAMVPMPKERTMEQLKKRYYDVAAQMMQVNKKVEVMNGAEFKLLQLMQAYSPERERARKEFAEKTFHRTKDEVKEEESLMIELRRILARSDRLAEERRELYARLETPTSNANVGIFTTSQGLQQLLQQLMSSDKNKKNRRSIMGGEGISPAGPNTGTQPPSFDRRESSARESISGPPGSAVSNKKGSIAGPNERRQLTPEEEALFGVRRPEKNLTSGPSFRHDRILKPVTSKSTTIQQKITNVLTELGVRPRLVMPTYLVGEAYEKLVTDVNLLLDERKRLDKTNGDLALLKGQLEAKQKALRAERGEAEPEAEGEPDGQAEGEGEEDEERKEEVDDGSDVDMKGVVDSSSLEAPEKEKEKEVKKEDRGEATTTAPRPGSGHKRSASVMSATSDSEVKRRKQ